MDNVKKLKRSAQVVSVLTKYGFDSLLADTNLRRLVPKRWFLPKKEEKSALAYTLPERIRMAIEELGCTYIKLGQLMSMREDMFPPEIIAELKKLQDDVAAEPLNIKQRLAEELGIDVDATFVALDTTPVAAASLAQAYHATIREEDTDNEVIIKVKRAGVQELIEVDLMIIKDIASVADRYFDFVENIGLVHIIDTFEKSILSEVSFTQERNNIERFAHNFRDDAQTIVPKTYPHLSNNNIVTMAKIDGFKIDNKQAFVDNGIDPEKIGHIVVDLYMRQVLEFGFFHSDPHAGNIFVTKEGKVAFIDFGSVGRLLPSDRDNLSDVVICIVTKDVNRLLKSIKRMCESYRIPNEQKLERDLHDLISLVDESTINELNIKEIMANFSSILTNNKVVMPDYIYLIVRGLILLEGIATEICPKLDLFAAIKPYATKLVIEKLSPKYLAKKGFEKIRDYADLFLELPNDLHNLIQKIEKDNMKITHRIDGLDAIQRTINRVVISVIILALSIGSGIMILAKTPPMIWDIPLFGFVGLLAAGAISVVLFLDIVRDSGKRKKH